MVAKTQKLMAACARSFSSGRHAVIDKVVLPVNKKFQPTPNKNNAIKPKIINDVKPPLVTINLNTLSENLGLVVNCRDGGTTPLYSVTGVVGMGTSC